VGEEGRGHNMGGGGVAIQGPSYIEIEIEI